MTLQTIEDVSITLDIPPRTLTYLEKIRYKLYSYFYIKKRDGRLREINPYLCDSSHVSEDLKTFVEYSKLLKTVHRKLNDILRAIEVPQGVYGFVAGVRDCAIVHSRKKYVISLDIKDFFPSIKSDDVYNALKDEGFGDKAAWLIARLVAYKGRLPQGAITSPAASNVAFKKKDFELIEYCKSHGFDYTRYADDITISTNKDLTDEEINQVISDIAQIIAPLQINEKKTKIMKPTDPHFVMGLIVNHAINVPKYKRRIVRAAVHNFVVKHMIPEGEDPIKYKRKLLGKVSYILYVNRIPSFEKIAEQLKKFDPNKVSDWQVIQLAKTDDTSKSVS